jgi:hypothetical protein
MIQRMDVHARIHAFAQQQTASSLLGDTPTFEDRQYMKAGIIPYVLDGSKPLYLMMKPHSKSSRLPPPTFQICKGTRMYLHRGSGWRDMRPGDEPVENKEDLLVTALREGVEEVGLMLEHIVSLENVGPYKFQSEKTGKNKYMWLFTAKLASQEHLLPMSDIAQTTAERTWMSAQEFEAVGREDHRTIVRDIAAKLQQHAA